MVTNTLLTQKLIQIHTEKSNMQTGAYKFYVCCLYCYKKDMYCGITNSILY